MIAAVNIHAAIRNGIPCLWRSYSTPPFKLADITEDKTCGALHIMLMSSSPGILDGDEYRLKILLDENCLLQLHTQSYQRLFNMKKGAEQHMEVHVQKGASFIHLPHPAVPHEHAVFKSTTKIYLQPGCRLVWGEVLTCGRKLNGEVFRFSKYHSITEVRLNNRLLVKENLLVQPALTDVFAMGQWEGYTHQASLICIAEATVATELIQEYLLTEKDIVFGISSLPADGFTVRLLGYRAEQLHACLKTIAMIINTAKKEPGKPIQHVG